jgi:hypothetical protein
VMTTYGDGFGRTYKKPVNVEDTSNLVRREKVITTTVNGAVVKVILRDTIISWDPYLNLIRASAYPWIVAQNGKGRPYFPVPPVSRRIKDALIKTTVQI